MKMNPLLLCLPALLVTFSTQAINVGEVTSMMGPDAISLAKEISNPTDTARFVSISVQRISSPMAGGVVIPMESKSELLSTPASMILPGSSTENFRFFYKGPADNKERYYRLTWVDEPVTDFGSDQRKKLGQATTSAEISTILVVAPRQEKFDYRWNKDTVTNTGNTSFRVISYGPCKDQTKDTGQGCRERYYLMPGVSTKIVNTNLADKKTRIGIWHGEQYINVN